MGILKSKFAPLVALFVLLLSFTPVTVFAGYTSWDQVPEKNKGYAKAFFTSLREEGLSVSSATAITARANSESGFDPYMLEGGTSSWEARMQAPTYDSPPAYGFLQMQDRSPGGRLGKMLAKVESYKSGKGTTDPTIAAEAQAKAVVEEFKSYDQFKAFAVEMQGSSAVVTSTGTTYPINLKEYGYKEKVDSWEKFKKIEDPRLATLVWTMSVVRPSGSAYGSSYKNDLAMLEPIQKEFGGLSIGDSKSSDNKVDANIASGDSGLPSEWELIGMSKRNYMYEHQNPIELPDRSELSVSEQYVVSNIKEDIKSTEKLTTINILRIAVAFIGIWFIVWGMLLIVSYVFDRSNVFIELSLVSILTAGTINVYALEDSDERSKSFSKVIKRVLLSLVTGTILISGTIYIGLSGLIYWLNDFIFSF